MAGTKITLPGIFTASTGKYLMDDSILPLTGALMLVDVAHSLGGMGVGVPADLAVIPNVAYAQAAAMIGSGNATTLGAILDRADGTNFNRERTALGGLHGYLSGSIASSVGMVLNMPTLIQNYIFANLTHKYYLSAWDCVTRVGTFTTSWPIFEGIQASIPTAVTANYIGYFDTSTVGDGLRPDSGSAKRLGARVSPAKNAVGNTFRNVAADGQTGAITTLRAQMALWGALNGYQTAMGGGTGAPSYILYRLYLEDLTVSGRTYAQVDAIDYAKWQTDFAVGGRFYGDTFTASPI